MILKHYFDFGDKENSHMNGTINWDYLRNESANPLFALEKTREDYIARVKASPVYERHAKLICEELGGGCAENLFSWLR